MTDRQTGGRDQLARTLRELRTAAGLSGAATARATGFSESKVSRLERGINVPTEDDVLALANAFKASPPVRRRLTEMAQDVRSENRRMVVNRDPAIMQKRIRRIEEASAHITTVSATMVPGMLQTEAYVRAVFVSGNFQPEKVDELVALRMGRQQLLEAPGPRFTLITTVGALSWSVIPGRLMTEQIEKIADACALTSPRVGVIPFGEHMPVLPVNSWDLYDQRAVLAGTMTAAVLLTEARDIAEYVRITAAMVDHALYGAEARAVLLTIADEYRRTRW